MRKIYAQAATQDSIWAEETTPEELEEAKNINLERANNKMSSNIEEQDCD